MTASKRMKNPGGFDRLMRNEGETMFWPALVTHSLNGAPGIPRKLGMTAKGSCHSPVPRAEDIGISRLRNRVKSGTSYRT